MFLEYIPRSETPHTLIKISSHCGFGYIILAGLIISLHHAHA